MNHERAAARFFLAEVVVQVKALACEMSDNAPWQNLFLEGTPSEPVQTVEFLLLRRHGEPFLLLPRAGRAAATALDLYPAQTRKARLAKGLMRLMLRLGTRTRLEKTTLRLRHADPLLKFMRQLTGVDAPAFAMFLGNPKTEGQRCVILLFNSRDQPEAVIKAGGGSRATELIAHEESFLKSVPPGLPGIPNLRSSFRSDGVRGFATDFFPGNSPPFDDLATVQKLLCAWILEGRSMMIAELPVWQRLIANAGARLSPLARELGGQTVARCVYHGDFVPWNIKVHRGAWTVLDWERGELTGMPLWDWLHFMIQPMILVERRDPLEILVRVKDMFLTPLFAEYAARANIEGLEVPLTLTYLDYCLHVIKPSEGLAMIRALVDLAQTVWPVPSMVNFFINR